jgi:hypothetical protein
VPLLFLRSLQLRHLSPLTLAIFWLDSYPQLGFRKMSADHVHLKLTTLETDAANATPAPFAAEPPVDASPVDGVHDFMVSIDDDDETNKENDHEEDIPQESPPEESDVVANEIIQKSKPTTDLELALTAALERKDVHIQRLMDEINKLRAFISKRKQTYKRKRKDDGAPTRALSGTHVAAWPCLIQARPGHVPNSCPFSSAPL